MCGTRPSKVAELIQNERAEEQPDQRLRAEGQQGAEQLSLNFLNLLALTCNINELRARRTGLCELGGVGRVLQASWAEV